jgi:hypothetical protein
MNYEHEVKSFCEAVEIQLRKEIPEASFKLFLVPKLERGYSFKSSGVARISFDIEVDAHNRNDVTQKVSEFWAILRNKIELEIER